MEKLLSTKRRLNKLAFPLNSSQQPFKNATEPTVFLIISFGSLTISPRSPMPSSRGHFKHQVPKILGTDPNQHLHGIFCLFLNVARLQTKTKTLIRTEERQQSLSSIHSQGQTVEFITVLTQIISRFNSAREKEWKQIKCPSMKG